MHKRTLGAVILLAASAMITAADAAERRLNFVSCPIVRDTKEVPCWIARYRGETYYLGIQQDIGAAFYPPQLKHQVLVEGVISDGPRICGGIVLKPVAISSLPEIDRSCDTILPAGGYHIDFAPRGAGPSRGGTPATDPTRRGRPPGQPPPAEASRSPEPFVVRFDFDNDFMTIRNSGQVSAAAQSAARDPALHVRVKGYRAATLLSDGKVLTEKDGIGRQRAEKVAQALREIGVEPSRINVSWADAAPAATGNQDYEHRRVEIELAP